MTLIQSLGPRFAPPPADLTLPEVFLDRKLKHPTTAQENAQIPALIDGESGQTVFLSEVCVVGFVASPYSQLTCHKLRDRTECLARSFTKHWSLGSWVFFGLCNDIYSVVIIHNRQATTR